MSKGLYIHIPFCRQKCIYCDFYSLAGEADERYADAVTRNITAYGGHYDTVFFGGGTPTLMPPSQTAKILCAADTAEDAEVTMEANPETVDADKLAAYRDAGVNRISFGVQSANDDELAMLHRIHDAETAVRAIETAGRYFDDISADIMLGLPFADERKLRHTLDVMTSLPLTHISAYILKVEEGTPLSRDRTLLSGIDEDRSADLYEMTVQYLADRGFEQYEISNFAREGCKCRHNLIYWHGEEYVGIGPGAYSFTGGRRFHVPRGIDSFITAPRQAEITDEESVDPEEERIMLGLRLTEGIALEGERRSRAEGFVRMGLMTRKGGRYALTVKGMLVSNEIIARII
ncbi:MAG: radical SAM family heme chaperone HemW [Oscillospiraceae bacterium]|nr:radical SAM family heme chaperone HemW [Oscillospiraceae bacterium]